MTADIVVYGKIYTSNEAHACVEAFAVRDGKFVYVGDAAGAKEYEGPDTKIIHAAFAMPGGIEAHGHFISEGAFKLGCYLDTMKDTPDGPALKMPEDYIEDLKKWRAGHPDEKGIYAYPYASELIMGGVKLTREVLDAAFPDIPVYISEASLHGGWCNTKCLEQAGVLNTQVPVETIHRDENGVAVGTVRDEACAYVRNHVFGAFLNDELYRQAVRNTAHLLNSMGYVAHYDAWSNLDGTDAMYRAISSVDKDGDATCLFASAYCIESFEDRNEGILNAAVLKNKYRSDHYYPIFVKLFADGVVESLTGYVSQPYFDGSHGTRIWEPEVMNDIVTKANAAGMLVHSHVYGDAASNEAINAYIESERINGKIYRNSLGHAAMIRDEDYPRILEHGIGVAFAGNWSAGSRIGEHNPMTELIGADRLREEYPVEQFAEYGIKAATSTDRPCGTAEDAQAVFEYLGVLVTGNDYRLGTDLAAKRDKHVSVSEGLEMLTINGAWMVELEQERGSIEVGKYADFLIADASPFDVDPKQICKIRLLETYFEGRQVYHS